MSGIIEGLIGALCWLGIGAFIGAGWRLHQAPVSESETKEPVIDFADATSDQARLYRVQTLIRGGIVNETRDAHRIRFILAVLRVLWKLGEPCQFSDVSLRMVLSWNNWQTYSSILRRSGLVQAEGNGVDAWWSIEPEYVDELTELFTSNSLTESAVAA